MEFECTQNSFFTINSTADEVLSAQGTPSAMHGDRWSYAFSSIEFEQGHVVGYSDISANLHVRLTPRANVHAALFGVGSTMDEVLAAQGTPSGVSGDRWSYGFSSVVFTHGKVSGYSDISNNLRVGRLPPDTTRYP